MELLRPIHLPDAMATDACSGFSSTASLRYGFGRNSLPVPEIVAGDKVYVAVGKSVDKAVSLFHWTFRKFRGREICILHVHQPSPLIPTLLGKLPATQANSDVVCEYRRVERDQMKKLLLRYMSLCARSKVKASVVTTENDQVRKGIVHLVNEFGVRKLVMGAVPESWMNVTKNSSKSSYIAKNAPPFCQIWFVNKSELLYTQEPAQGQDSDMSRSQSSCYPETEGELHQGYLRSSSSTSFTAGSTSMMRTKHCHEGGFRYLRSGSSSDSGYSSSVELELKVEEVNMEAEASRNEAFQELLKRKLLEAQASEAYNKVKAYESAYTQELESRKLTEDALNAAKQENKQLLERKEITAKDLRKTIRNISVLETQLHEANRRREESFEELKLIHTSIATLKIEKLTVQRTRLEAENWLARWRTRGEAGGACCTGKSAGDASTSARTLPEFSLLDLETATCGFSESFELAHERYGFSVYKGEMSNTTVMIKKLHSNNLQAQSEFQQEVQVVRKLQHKHILRLTGICPEAYALIYEYAPTSLEDHLSKNSNSYSINWKIRTRIIFEVGNALLFLHSSRPKTILHGNLKPKNILLDSKLASKLCNFRFSNLGNKETTRCHSFRQYVELNGPFSFTDPEFHRTGNLTEKSDVYSFGMIILWLLTGSGSSGLAGEVKKAVLGCDLGSVLDESAGEWPSFVARRLVDLGLRCCESSSQDRPGLTPGLVKELQRLSVHEDRQVPSFFLCPILKEIMYDPQLAADGFTYEGEALRGWFKNGRDTSPMTNLKLSHLDLIPNHSLRLAIQDWLFK